MWGDDLRVEGIVVERLDGADHLADEVQVVRAGPAIAGSACSSTTWCRAARRRAWPTRCATRTCSSTGTPYVDVWQAVRPRRSGIDVWPVVPKGQDWKTGVCAASVSTTRGDVAPDPRRGHDWKQLEQPFVAAVEQLIDFVTE